MYGAAGQRELGFQGSPTKGEQSHGGHGGGPSHGDPPEEDWELQHPRCVFQILTRHFARYTPELVADTSGCTVEDFEWHCNTLCVRRLERPSLEHMTTALAAGFDIAAGIVALGLVTLNRFTQARAGASG